MEKTLFISSNNKNFNQHSSATSTLIGLKKALIVVPISCDTTRPTRKLDSF